MPFVYGGDHVNRLTEEQLAAQYTQVDGFVTQCLVGVVGAALGFCVKEIHIIKLGNCHVSAQFFSTGCV